MKKNLLNKWLALKEKEKKKDQSKTTSKYPLAYNQQALYFLYHLYPENPFYNYLDYYHFEGWLEIEKLIETFNIIISRNDVFRTCFTEEEGVPVQIVSDHGELEIYRHNLDTGNEEDAKSLIIQDANRPFDLSSNKQLRLSIVQYNDKAYSVGVIAHHIIVDKWSMGMLRTEVAEIYQQLCQNNQSMGQPSSFSFGEYAYDQVNKPIDKDLIKYWLEKLEHENDPINLPYDYLRPDQPTFKGRHYKVSLGSNLSEALKNQCYKLKVTPFVYLIAVFKILLYKYSGRSSFNIGVPFSNKQNAELESIIGFFDETVILHARIKDQKFAEFIEIVASEVYDLFDKKQVPLELLVKELNPDRTSGINPLFQVMFIYHKKPKDLSFGKDLKFSSETLDTGVTKFDLSLFVGEDEEKFSLTFEYATDLFKEETIASFSDHFINLLTQVINDPGKRINQLSLLSETDFNHIVHDWNNTAFEIDSTVTILDDINKQCKVAVDQVAVADSKKRLRYGELDAKANSLSSFLAENNLAAGQIVGLHMGRSVEMVIAILAVLRSGAAYLPLDPEYPENRINHMIQDAGVSLIISDQPEVGYQNVKIYSIVEILQDEKPGTSPIKVLPSDIAYVIYTSGSTGEPKGVAVTHANLYNSTKARQRYYGSDPQSYLLFSSFSFDSSVAGIFWGLSSGGKLVISENRLEQDLEKLGSVINHEKVTHTLLLPGLYKEILYSINKENLKTLKNVILAGEAIDETLPAMHFKNLVEVQLFNEYGPTEATVWASVEKITDSNPRKITIGKPIGNTQIFILDNDMQPLPIGIPGEIYIGGLNVTKGYLNHPEATSEKFVKSPFNHFPGMLYKTGDLAKFTPEGKIDFMGRKDGQVKIRGHRVELKEIESKINQLEHVKESVVIIEEEKGLNKRLFCYYIAERNIDSSEFKSWLDTELPDFMIPNRFIAIDKFPRLPNGKLDRKKLPKPSTTDKKIEFESPQSESEQIMVEIWQEVLKLDKIGINDDFFEIGGDSISSIRIISKAKSQGLKIKPDQIFKYPTIAELTSQIEFDTRTGQNQFISFIGQSKLTPIQHWFFSAFKNEPHYWNLSCRITFNQSISKDLLLDVFEKVVQRHNALRQIFISEEGIWKSVYTSFPVKDYIDYLPFNDFKSKFIDLQNNVQLDKGPLFRMILNETKYNQPETNEIILLAHHLLVDIVSWSIILEDFKFLLGTLKAGKSIESYSIPNQFSEWATFINSKSAEQIFQKEINYWINHTDHTESRYKVSQTYEYDIISKPITLDRQSTRKLVNEALDVYQLKLFELILCAYVKTIGDTFNTHEMIIWTEKHGRRNFADELDFNQSVGWFTSYFPLRFTLTDSIKSNIINVKETVRSVPNEGIGYAYLAFIKNNQSLLLKEKFSFNYFGVQEQVSNEFIKSVEFIFDDVRSPDSEANHMVEFNCSVQSGKLKGDFRLNKKLLSKEEFDRFDEVFIDNLKQVIEHCLSANQEYTPSDFPDANLSKDDFDALLDQL